MPLLLRSEAISSLSVVLYHVHQALFYLRPSFVPAQNQNTFFNHKIYILYYQYQCPYVRSAQGYLGKKITQSEKALLHESLQLQWNISDWVYMLVESNCRASL